MDLLARLTAEHRQFMMAMGQIDSLLLDSDHRYCPKDCKQETSRKARSILNRLAPAMRRHEDVERRFLFPALLRALPGWAPIIREMESEHQRLGAILMDFECELSKDSEVPNHVIMAHTSHLMGRMQIHMLREELEVFGPARELAPHVTADVPWPEAREPVSH